jgi:hypothetical protein
MKETVMRVSTYHSDQEVHGIYDITVQECERWNPRFDELVAPPSTLVTFLVEEHSHILDIVRIIPTVSALQTFFAWEICESDVDDCLALCNPTLLNSVCKLRDPACPTLCLLNALRAKEFIGNAEKIYHVSGGPAKFDSRKPIAHKRYLQCVLAQTEIFAAGGCDFSSQMTQSFYDLLLRSPSKARPDLSAKECQRILSLADGLAPALATLDADASVPSVPGSHQQPPSAMFQDDSDVSGDAPNASTNVRARAPVAAAAPVANSQVSASSSSSSSSSSNKNGGAAVIAHPMEDDDVDPGPLLATCPEHILGQHVKLEIHRKPDGSERGRGIRVQCSNPEHTNCHAYRSLRLDVIAFGQRAAEFFLITWLLSAHEMPEAAHRKFRPSRAEVRVIYDTYGP